MFPDMSKIAEMGQKKIIDAIKANTTAVEANTAVTLTLHKYEKAKEAALEILNKPR